MKERSLGEALSIAQRRGRVAEWGLGGIAFVSAFMALSIALDHRVSALGTTRGEATDILVGLSKLNEGIVLLAFALDYLITAVAFMMWFHASYKLLPELGATHLEYTPGQAAASFVIPILCFFRPYQVMRDLWFSSDPGSKDNPVSTPLLLRFWWGLFLLHTILDRMSPRSAGAETDAAAIGSYANIGPDLVRIGAAVVAIFAVRSVMSRQERRVAQLLFSSSEGATNDSIPA